MLRATLLREAAGSHSSFLASQLSLTVPFGSLLLGSANLQPLQILCIFQGLAQGHFSMNEPTPPELQRYLLPFNF